VTPPNSCSSPSLNQNQNPHELKVKILSNKSFPKYRRRQKRAPPAKRSCCVRTRCVACQSKGRKTAGTSATTASSPTVTRVSTCATMTAIVIIATRCTRRTRRRKPMARTGSSATGARRNGITPGASSSAKRQPTQTSARHVSPPLTSWTMTRLASPTTASGADVCAKSRNYASKASRRPGSKSWQRL